MLKEFAKSSAIYGGSHLLSRAIAFLLLPVYARALSPAEMGALDLVHVLTAFVNVTVALEIAQAVGIFHSEAKTPEERRAFASTALWFTLITNLAFVVPAVLLAGPLSRWLFESEGLATAFSVAAASIGAGGLYILVQVQLRYELRPGAFAASSIVLAVVTAGVTILLVTILRWGPLGAFLGQLAGNAAGAAVGLFCARSSYGTVFDVRKWRAMLRFSLPLVPASVATIACVYVDRFFIKELMSIADLGIYGVAFRIALVASLAVAGFRGSFTPLVVAHAREPGTPEQLARIFRYFLAFALGIFLVLSVFATEAVGILAGAPYAAAAAFIPLLVAAALLSNMYLFAPGLLLAKRTGLMALIAILAALLNTGLNFFLIPKIGLFGASLAAVAGGLVSFLATLAFSQRLYPVPHRWGGILLASAAAVALVAGTLALERNLMAFGSLLLWGIKGTLVLGGGTAIAWVLLGTRELAGLLRRKRG